MSKIIKKPMSSGKFSVLVIIQSILLILFSLMLISFMLLLLFVLNVGAGSDPWGIGPMFSIMLIFSIPMLLFLLGCNLTIYFGFLKPELVRRKTFKNNQKKNEVYSNAIDQ